LIESDDARAAVSCLLLSGAGGRGRGRAPAAASLESSSDWRPRKSSEPSAEELLDSAQEKDYYYVSDAVHRPSNRDGESAWSVQDKC
jgi:hypothetical protein